MANYNTVDRVDPIIPEVLDLTESERQQLMQVMIRAKEFETQEESKQMRQPLEGQLMKYTNVMKGWQYRWFILNPDAGTLEYFVPEIDKRQRVRGSVFLAGAVISPSDEDSQTFTVNSASGDVYKLRATDARERQHWVNRLRAAAEFHTQTIAQMSAKKFLSKMVNNPPLPPREHWSPSFGRGSPVTARRKTQETLRTYSSSSKISNFKSGMDPFIMVKDILVQVGEQQLTLARNIENLPDSSQSFSCLDHDLLLLKATSQATLLCLEQCLEILQQLQVGKSSDSGSCRYTRSYTNLEWVEPKTQSFPSRSGSRKSHISKAESQGSILSGISPTVDDDGINILSEDEISDTEDHNDQDLGTVEEHKSIILHLLSQLKLGMDLTRVVLPTFILERRSLLEMFADFMSHADMFIKIPDESTPEERILAVLKWYLTSFHVGRKGSIAKKPYNPIIGELFHCSWSVPKQSLHQTSTPDNQSPNILDNKLEGYYRVKFTAEQVSHHPPVSAFYVECPEKKICMNAHVWTKSKFMGMSIGVNMIGEVNLCLIGHGEDYVFSLPSAFARSILTVPWSELGGKVTISCLKSGYSSSIMFHTKPFYGGKLHHITAEVKNTLTGVSVCKVAGEWNGSMEFTYANGNSEIIDTNKLNIVKKRIQSFNKQGPMESRKLWYQTTKSLKVGDLNSATEYKKFLEDKQRTEEKRRQENNTSFIPKYFHREGDGWIYNWYLKNKRGSFGNIK